MRIRLAASALLAAGVLLAAAGPAWASPSGGAPPVPVPGPGTVAAAGAPPLPTSITGTSWLVADMDTGAILAAKDAHHRLLPASTLKVLTALALLPVVDRSRILVPSYADVAVEGSRVGLQEHVSYTADEIFKAMLMVSGNDAANTLASAAGGMAHTADLMNAAAARVGALDTHAVNPSGLNAPGQLTTAYDLALIGRAAMQLPAFRAYVAMKQSTITGTPGRPMAIASHDKVLWNYPGAIGIKNGYTIAAMATYIGAATRDGHTLIVTELHAQPRIWPEIAALLDWGFAAERAGATPVGRLDRPTTVVPPVPAPPVARLHPAAALRPQPAGPGGTAGVPFMAVGLLGSLAVLLLSRRPARHGARQPRSSDRTVRRL